MPKFDSFTTDFVYRWIGKKTLAGRVSIDANQFQMHKELFTSPLGNFRKVDVVFCETDTDR